jgi:hypothetical protein
VFIFVVVALFFVCVFDALRYLTSDDVEMGAKDAPMNEYLNSNDIDGMLAVPPVGESACSMSIVNTLTNHLFVCLL